METQTAENVESWAPQTTRVVSTEELDKAISEMQMLWDVYDTRKKASNEAHATYTAQEAVVMELLKTSGKSKYFVDGLGTAYIMSKYQIKVPKTTAEKELLFKYIETKYGRDVMLDYSTVNYQKLNAFYNEEKEIVKDAAFRLPGIPDVEHTETIGFRKA